MATSVPKVVTSLKRPLTASRQSIYEESTTRWHTVGDLLVLGERKFRYASNSTAAALAIARMTTGTTVVTGHKTCPVVLAAIGTTTPTFTLSVATAAAANLYADGYVWVSAGTGIGQTYKVKSHAAWAASTSTTMSCEFYDPLVTALDTTSRLGFYKNPWRDVVVYPATNPTNMPTGATLFTVTISTTTTTYYFWAQTGGLCALYTGATYGIGTPIGVDNIDGMGLTLAADSSFAWGVVVSVAATTDAPSLVFLNID